MNTFTDLDHDSAVLVADLLNATEKFSAHIQQALADEDPEGARKIQADLMAGKIEIVWFLTADSIRLMAVSNDRDTKKDVKIFELDLTGNDDPQEADIYGAGVDCLH